MFVLFILKCYVFVKLYVLIYEICKWAQVYVDVNDTKTALRRRGPDNLGIKNVFIWPNVLDNQSFVCESDYLAKRVMNSCGKLEFIGATLQLRGSTPVTQPLVDSFGNVLVYNGMVYLCVSYVYYV